MKNAPITKSNESAKEHHNNNIAFELIGELYQTLNSAVFVATTTSEQTKAVTTYCDRFDALFTDIDNHTDESFNDELKAILAMAVKVWKACESEQIQITCSAGGVHD